jgi:glycosyltransferase involved in cell wall biosynthesis
LWQFDEYFGVSWKAMLLKATLPYLRARDLKAAKGVDRFLAISKVTQGYIREFYGQPADVIPSPINLSAFRTAPKQSHYLLVSRLERWKKVDYAIEAFNRTGAPLRIIGAGEQEAALRSMAGRNIEFLGPVDDERLAKEYSEARAVIFTPNLEYGLVPLEANASGTPVICYGNGGITETMIPVTGTNASGAGTAVFFYEQTADALIDAVRQFELCVFDPAKLMGHAAQWSVPMFQNRLREAVERASTGRPAVRRRA